jgi:hypothetical protein
MTSGAKSQTESSPAADVLWTSLPPQPLPFDAVPSPWRATSPTREDWKRRLLGLPLVLSLLGHLLVAALLILGLMSRLDRPPPTPKPGPAPIQITLIATAPSPLLVETATQQPTPNTENAAPSMPSRSINRKPTKPAEPKQRPATGAPAVGAGVVDSAAPSSEVSESTEDWLGRVRDLWLQPLGAPRQFRCRLRIQYAANGELTAVKFLQNCGSVELEDSVQRAIWKSRGLKLPATRRQAGQIDVDFTQ